MPASFSQTTAISLVRGLLIGFGSLLLVWLHPTTDTQITGVIIGLVLQIVWWLALWAVRRYEQNNQLEGALQPIVVFILELLIDAVTVALFAHAVLSSWWSAGQAL